MFYRKYLFAVLLIPVIQLNSLNAASAGEKKTDSETEIGGVLMLDYAAYDGVYRNDTNDESEFNTEIRRARIDLKHRLNKQWKGKLQISFDEDDNSSEIGDAYLQYSVLDSLFKGADITFGQTKEAFGLENLTSSKNTTFLERSMATNAFAPGRNKGVSAFGSPKDFTWELGVYDVETDDEDFDPYAVTGRFTWAPVITNSDSDKQLFHLGLAGSWRKLDGDEFEINERAEVHSAEKIISSGEIDTDKVSLFGIEVAWVKGPLSVQSEYMRADLKAIDESEDATFDGYYIQSSYFLTGESRSYKNGVFGKLKPNAKTGAWEVSARYSVLDTREADDGTLGETATLGLNYYYDENIRVMANLLHSEVSGDNVGEDLDDEDQGNALSLRFQYEF